MNQFEMLTDKEVRESDVQPYTDSNCIGEFFVSKYSIKNILVSYSSDGSSRFWSNLII